MLSKTADVFASSLSLSTDDSSAYGLYKNYFIVYREDKKFKILDISCHLDVNDDDAEYENDNEGTVIGSLEISDRIKECIDKYSINDYELLEDRLRVTSTADISLFREMLDALIDILTSNNIEGSTSCTRCGKSFNNSGKRKVVTVAGVKSLVCESCAFELLEQNNIKKEAERKSKSKPAIAKILLGALAGGLIGAVIYALLFMIPVSDNAGILKYFVCLAGLVVGALSALGAKYAAGGRYSKPYVVIVTVCSVLFTAIAQYFGTVIYAVRTYASFEVFKFNAAPFFKVVFSSDSLVKYFGAGTIIGICAAGFSLIFIISSMMKKAADSASKPVTVTSLK